MKKSKPFSIKSEMGHDVEIVGTGVVLYISGNFSCLDQSYGGVYRIHGHPGKIVAKIVRKTIEKANADGFVASEPDHNNPDWGWGVKNGNKLPEKEFMGVFLYHMNRFLDAANKYPESYFRSDEVFSVIPYEETSPEANLLSAYGIDPNADNLNILKTVLSKWSLLKDVKNQADFWVHSVAIWDIEEKERNGVDETMIVPNTDLDGVSLYSGDTQSEHDVLKDLVCQLFHGKDCGDTRYRIYKDQEEQQN